ncbi:MAG TPA: N-acetylmuramoyl-L-alanine amidase [Egicoccus sp.]|nr:N-acetylmuramoyl-L-alanine amidase [Egicoccus sp.]HSK25185.1 N-acetylmuramoyl-L-alanine amidase [Egicoccus sp.]
MRRVRRRHVLFLMTAVTGATLVPVAPSFATEVAPPETVVDTLDDLPEAPVAGDAQGTPVVETDTPFSMIGFTLPEGADEVTVRTRGLDGTWSGWEVLEREVVGLDGPDLGTEEAEQAETDASEPLWVGDADAFEVRVDGAVAELSASLIDTEGFSESAVDKVVRHLRPQVVPVEAEAASRPAVISRRQWGANESMVRRAPGYATPRFAVIHHTAGSNSYSKSQSASVVRGIYSYHVNAQGWNDIGYNILVDRYGQIFEGRAGGLERGVIGAHASGFNTSSIGVSVMGNFDKADIPSVALESVARVVAWKYDLHGIDARASRTISQNGKSINVTTAHRNVGSTACPGRYFYAKMGSLRSRIQALSTGAVPAAPTPPKPDTRFWDVPATHGHYAPIEDIAKRGVTSGCGRYLYCPTESVTRAQMASFIFRAFDVPEATRPHRFRDLGDKAHQDAIAAITEAGIANGCSRRRYCPDREVSRGEMAAFLQRALDLPLRPSPFRDTAHSVFDEAIGAISEAGIASGVGRDRYEPGTEVHRAGMALFLARALED